MVSQDFRRQLEGYGLTTAKIMYRRPDHQWLLQTYVWQDFDLFPKLPELNKFLNFWTEKLDGPLHSVMVAHARLPSLMLSTANSGYTRAKIPETKAISDRFLCLARAVCKLRNAYRRPVRSDPR